jgi:short-subunit dehydrogenase
MNSLTKRVVTWTALGGATALGLGALARARRRMDFAGKAVLITGGSRGLGLTLARELAAEGARLALVARDGLELELARAELPGATVVGIQRDLTQPGEPAAAVQDAVDALGGLDVLINNAGVMDVGPFESLMSADYERALALHLWAPLAATSAALPWLARERGRVVNIASIGGTVAVPHMAPYCASKFALVGLSDSLRAELRRHRVYVTTVCPGLMRTGSHVNATFRGAHESEYAWFATSAALGSVSAARAAREILTACRYGKAHLTISLPARLLIVANALLPNLIAEATALFARALPKAPPGQLGVVAYTGWESRDKTPAVLTARADKEIEPHNQDAPNSPEGSFPG